MDKPVSVGPHVRTRGFCTLVNAFLACLTAVWIVNAGSALRFRKDPFNLPVATKGRDNIHGSHRLEDRTLDGHQAETCRLREIRGLERCGALSVGFVRLITYVSAAIREHGHERK